MLTVLATEEGARESSKTVRCLQLLGRTEMSTITRPPTVLLIDDEDDTRSIWGMVLELAGMNVVCAGTGEEGISAAITHRPDLIITDFMMPGLTALKCAAEFAPTSACATSGSFFGPPREESTLKG